MNDIQIFNNEEFGDIRTVIANNEPMFCLADVCKALGLTQASKVKDRLNEKGVNTIPTLTVGGEQKLLYINEANLYKTIFQSRKESAERFTDWVTGTVLPSIRQNGGYIANQENMTEEELLAKAVLVAQKTIDSLKDRCQFLGGQVADQQKVIEELQPKASYYDMILQCKDLIATTVIAKDYGMSAKKFNAILHELGFQFKQGDVWVLYAKYQGNGYLKTKTHNFPDAEGVQHSKEHSYWTQKGRLFLYDLLKQNDIFPLMEKDLLE